MKLLGGKIPQLHLYNHWRDDTRRPSLWGMEAIFQSFRSVSQVRCSPFDFGRQWILVFLSSSSSVGSSGVPGEIFWSRGLLILGTRSGPTPSLLGPLQAVPKLSIPFPWYGRFRLDLFICLVSRSHSATDCTLDRRVLLGEKFCSQYVLHYILVADGILSFHFFALSSVGWNWNLPITIESI